MAGTRVERLKDLVTRIERLPASPERDRVLSEVRSRAVDLDTGVTPRAMLPVREPVPALVLASPPKRDRPSPGPQAVRPSAIGLAHSSSAPGLAHSASASGLAHFPSASGLAHSPSARRRTAEAEQTLGADDRLSLEDAPLPHVRAQGDRPVPSWTQGLRA